MEGDTAKPGTEASKDSGVPEAESAKGAYAGIGAKSTNSIRLRYPRERR